MFMMTFPTDPEDEEDYEMDDDNGERGGLVPFHWCECYWYCNFENNNYIVIYLED